MRVSNSCAQSTKFALALVKTRSTYFLLPEARTPPLVAHLGVYTKSEWSAMPWLIFVKYEPVAVAEGEPKCTLEKSKSGVAWNIAISSYTGV